MAGFDSVCTMHHIYIYIYIHICMRTCVHTYIHAYIYIHSHINALYKLGYTECYKNTSQTYRFLPGTWEEITGYLWAAEGKPSFPIILCKCGRYEDKTRGSNHAGKWQIYWMAFQSWDEFSFIRCCVSYFLFIYRVLWWIIYCDANTLLRFVWRIGIIVYISHCIIKMHCSASDQYFSGIVRRTCPQMVHHVWC